MSATQPDLAPVNEGTATTSVQTVVQPLTASANEACNTDAHGKQVQSNEERDIKKGITDDWESMLTSKSMLIGVGGLIGLLIVLWLIRNMIRVR